MIAVFLEIMRCFISPCGCGKNLLKFSSMPAAYTWNLSNEARLGVTEDDHKKTGKSKVATLRQVPLYFKLLVYNLSVVLSPHTSL